MILHAQPNRKTFYYTVHYVQFIHDVTPVKDMKDDTWSPTTSYFFATKLKPHVCHFRVVGHLAIFKIYDYSSNAKWSTEKYSQQGICGIFVSFPTDSVGCLFYVPDANHTYVSMDVIFYEDFTFPIHLLTLPYQGARNGFDPVLSQFRFSYVVAM